MAKRLLLFLVFAFSHSLVALGGKNYYEILQVSEEASEDQIKRAYRKLALKYHPNKNAGNEEANMRFAEINNAYDVLSDREKRSTYDQDGEERLKRHASGGGRDAVVNIQDIFNKRSYFMRKVSLLSMGKLEILRLVGKDKQSEANAERTKFKELREAKRRNDHLNKERGSRLLLDLKKP